MKKIKTLQCIRCGKDHKLIEAKYNCSACGGNLQVLYDYNLIKKRLNYEVLKDNPERSIWRYIDILPISNLKNVPPVQVGWTPLYRAEKLGAVISLWVGDQQVLSWEDPDPLPGGRLGVWTEDNAVMIPRVTIYHREGAPSGRPGA